MIRQASRLYETLCRRQLLSSIYPESVEYRDKLKSLLEKPCTVYCGFDATSDCLHVGHLSVFMTLAQFYLHGHQTICLIGDATARVGDPSGHDKDRVPLLKGAVETNAAAIEDTIDRLYNNLETFVRRQGYPATELKKPMLIRNSQWYNDNNVIDFMTEAFRYVRVGSLLHKKHIQERVKSSTGINMSEFSYQIFQAYDWLKLRELYDCKLQVGGSDQGGNIYTGHDLIKKISNKTDSIGILAPLILGKKGKKLSKTEGKGNIYMSAERTPPRNLYNFFHSTPDSEIDRYLRIFTLYDEDTIDQFMRNDSKKPDDIWFCHKRLAESVCQLVHGTKEI